MAAGRGIRYRMLVAATKMYGSGGQAALGSLGVTDVALVTGYCGVINCYCYIPCPRQIRTADHTPLDSDCGGRSNFFDGMYLLVSRNKENVCCLRAPGRSSGPASARFLPPPPPPPRSPAAGPRCPSFRAGSMGAKQQLTKSRCDSARPTHYS